VPVPETAVYEDGCVVLPQRNVWRARQRPDVDPITEPVRIKVATHQHFWFGVSVTDAAHRFASLLGRQSIHSFVNKSLDMISMECKNNYFW